MTETEIPPDAFRAPKFLAITDIERHDGAILDLHTVIFVNAGSMLWFEEPNVLAVWHVPARVEHPIAEPLRRYQGVWREAGDG